MKMIVFFLAVFALTQAIELPITYIPSLATEYDNKLISHLELPLKKNVHLVPSIQIALGSHKQEMRVFLSTIDHSLYVSDYDYKLSISSEISNAVIALDFINEGVKGQTIKDELSVGGKTIRNFPFVQILNSDIVYYYKGSLGLGFPLHQAYLTNPELNNSLLYHLKFYNIIDRYVVSLSPDTKDQKLLIGEYPSNYPKHPTQFNYRTCPLITHINHSPNKLWQCNLNSVYVEDNALFTINQPIRFSLGESLVNVSQDFFEYLIEKYFKDALQSGICIKKVGRYDYIKCRDIFSIAMKEINFVFGKWTLKLRINDLFDQPSPYDEYMFRIIQSTQYLKNEWTFGLNILQHRYQPVFDAEKDVFGLLYISS